MCALLFCCCFISVIKQLQGCHLSSTSKFPDFSLTFYSFSYPLTDLKKSFLFFSLKVLTVSLKIWGLLLKERICSFGELILSFKGSPPPPPPHLRLYLMRKYNFSPLENKIILKSTCHSHLFSNSLIFFLTFQVFS